MLRATLRDRFFRYGWDTRCRNLVPATLLRPLLERARRDDPPAQAGKRRAMLLDVGCGSRGVATFLPGVPVQGVDLPQDGVAETADFKFTIGSILDLPFGDRSFPYVSCVDVVEHLPTEIRGQAIGELLRVAERGVLIACPHGDEARRCDERFEHGLRRRHRPLPSWLDEHLRQPYPTVDSLSREIHAAADRQGRSVTIEVSFSEPTLLCQAIRSTSMRSSVLYAGINLLFGLALPLVPVPGPNDSYRCVLLVSTSR